MVQRVQCAPMSPDATQKFLVALSETGVMARSARIAGVKYSEVMTLRQRDADFAAACDEAMEIAGDTLEAEARRRAVEGVNEPVVYQGQLTPLWERNADGTTVMEAYEIAPASIGDGGDEVPAVLGTRPKQLVINGVPQFLSVRKYSDTLLQFLLKGRRRAVFGDKQEITGAGGSPLMPGDETERAARIAALMAIAERRKAAQQDDDRFSNLC